MSHIRLNKKRRKHSGFTLVELVTTIVLLGVFAAIALPKFGDNTEAAQIAVVTSTAGALKSGIRIAQLKWRLSNNQRTNVALVGENVSSNFINMVDFSQYGCPVQHWRVNTETNPSANNSTDCRTVFAFLLNSCPTGATDCGGAQNENFDAAYLGGGSCEYTYRENTNFRIRYDSGTQSCAVSTSGF